MRRRYQKNIWNDFSIKSLVATIGIIIVLTIFIAFFIFYQKESEKLVELDDEFCPEFIPAISVVLIDQTDSFNVFQKKSIQNSVKDIVESLAKHERLEIYILNPIEEKLLEPIFAICNPGQGEDENKYTGNKKLKKYNWDKKFYQPFSENLDRILIKQKAEISPIMESIQSISLTTFHNHRQIPIKFYIISDMLQHSTLYSNYKNSLDYERFKSSKRYNKLSADLNGVTAKILYINRDVKKQGRNHILFWENYFTDMGGILTSVKRIEG